MNNLSDIARVIHILPVWVSAVNQHEALPCVMGAKVTLDKVIAFLRIYLTFACCWPLSPNATKFQRLLHSAFRYFCCINTIIYIITAIRTLSKNDDYMAMMKMGCELSAGLQIILQLILFAMQDKRLQVRFLFVLIFHIKELYPKN